jgi:hypothetical protein
MRSRIVRYFVTSMCPPSRNSRWRYRLFSGNESSDGAGPVNSLSVRYHRPSRCLTIAGLSGFLTLSQSREGPDALSLFETMPSRPMAQACRNTVAPSASVCSLRAIPTLMHASTGARLPSGAPAPKGSLGRAGVAGGPRLREASRRLGSPSSTPTHPGPLASLRGLVSNAAGP